MGHKAVHNMIIKHTAQERGVKLAEDTFESPGDPYLTLNDNHLETPELGPRCQSDILDESEHAIRPGFSGCEGDTLLQNC